MTGCFRVPYNDVIKWLPLWSYRVGEKNTAQNLMLFQKDIASHAVISNRLAARADSPQNNIVFIEKCHL